MSNLKIWNERYEASQPQADAGRRPLRRSARRSERIAGWDVSWDAERELQALQTLRLSFEAHHRALDDPELMLILAEGETSLLEVLDGVLEADLRDEGLIHGLKQIKDTMAVRLHRLEERKQSRRAILEQALLTLEQKSLERPTATITLSERAPSLLVEEEAQIPARFFDLKPVLNRRLAKEALEAGEDVPGARLSSGALTLTVRRR